MSDVVLYFGTIVCRPMELYTLACVTWFGVGKRVKGVNWRMLGTRSESI